MEYSKGIVILAYEPQGVDFFSNCTKIAGKSAVLDPDIARMAGANFAIGSREALDELRGRLDEGSIKTQLKETPGLSIEATKWLASGSRGISSNTMFTALTGVDAMKGWETSHPHDPADLDRCLRLIEEVPELKTLIGRMSGVSEEWRKLISRWDELCACHINEVGLGWTKAKSAPKTYALMQEIFKGE